MRTKTYTINLYTFDELSELAKRNALYKWEVQHDPFCDEEFRDCLSAIQEKTDISITDWEIGGINDHIHGYINLDSVNEIKTECRLNAWICNNWEHILSKNKRYWSKKKSYTSKTLKTTDFCELTGTYTDYSFLKAIHDQLSGNLHFTDIDSLINYALNELCSAWREDRDYEFSEEYFQEICSENDYEFNVDGEIIQEGA